MGAQSTQNLFTGSLISSLISAILILATDFSGWYNYSTYGEVWGWVGFSFSNIISFLVFGSCSAVLFFCAYISYMRLSGQKVPHLLIQKAFYGSLGVCILALAGIFYFIITMIDMGPSTWWVGPAAYAGSIGGGLTAIFFNLALAQKTAPAGSRAPKILAHTKKK